ncbi:right-handed parallel beta-helix repeat-containing protein [Flocculibacter collagenilyticus]|uniref:hypothetical protein n=1 Tax=Flocculibacter collagenilyticus TaxID=2744479 RepID=UPI0018F5679D|nr:hypothetical protein [Flocculibacter collagenilyticus]
MKKHYIVWMCLFSLVYVHASFAQQLQSGAIYLNDTPQASLQDALSNARDGDRIKLGNGIFRDGGILNANFVTITGGSNTHIRNFSAKGKGALVIKGNDTTIENIECSGVTVPDKNGACIRLAGRNLKLNNVYFHDSEQGLLTGSKPGSIYIENSRFERLGKAGRAHGVYVGGGELYINNSHFLSGKDEGHEIKSRARKTMIYNSTIASLTGKDSRLLDISNGGILEVNKCVLEQGDNTSNWNLIGFGMEGLKYKENSIKLSNNLILLDRERGNKLIATKGKAPKIMVNNNVIIGKLADDNYNESNIRYQSRDEAGVQAFPSLLTDNKNN